MDSREPSMHSTITPPHYAYHHQLHNNNNSIPSNLIPNPAYDFNSLSAPLDSALLSQQHQNQQHHHQQQNGSASGAAPDAEQSGKRRRGRPRKYSPDADGLGSSNSQVASVAAGGSGSVKKEITGEVNGEGNQGKRQRGRPPGSVKKQLDALGGVAGSGFTPHVIKVFPKEDIVSKVNEFCQEGPRKIIIISAFGAVCNATIQLPGLTDENGTIFCEGCSYITNLAGPYFCMNCDGSRGNNFELIISLVGSDGKFSGGRVVGKLIAATTIQIIAGSYIEEQKKSNSNIPPVSSPLPTPVSHVLDFGGHSTGNHTAPNEAASDSHQQASFSHSVTHSLRSYDNTNYPMHNLPIYQQHMGWGNTGLGDMHHNHNNNR